MKRRSFLQMLGASFAALFVRPAAPPGWEDSGEWEVLDTAAPKIGYWEYQPATGDYGYREATDDTARLQALVSSPGAVVAYDSFCISGRVECADNVKITNCRFWGPGEIDLGAGETAARVEDCVFEGGPQLRWRWAPRP